MLIYVPGSKSCGRVSFDELLSLVKNGTSTGFNRMRVRGASTSGVSGASVSCVGGANASCVGEADTCCVSRGSRL